MSKFRTCIVGAEHVDGGYLNAFLNNPEIDVTVLCYEDEDWVKVTAEKHKVPKYSTDYEEVLSSKDIEVVALCTPDHLHAEQSIKALQADKHVLCEKPMATSIEDCKNIVKAADETQKVFVVSQFYRFDPVHIQVKKLCESGNLGEVFFVEGSYIHDLRRFFRDGKKLLEEGKTWRPQAWRVNPANPQNLFLGGGCHPMDLVRWINGGEVEEIFAYSNKKCVPEFPLDDFYVAILRFANGCVGKVGVTVGCVGRLRFVFHPGEEGIGEGFINVWGTKGTIYRGKWYYSETESRDIEAEGTKKGPIFYAVDHFVECIKSGKKPLIDARDGARTVATLVAGLESIRKHRPVKVFSDF